MQVWFKARAKEYLMFKGHEGVLPYNGKWPKLAEDVFIAPGAQVIGDVEIGSGSSIWFNTIIRGDDNPIRIGKRVNIQDGSVVHVHSKYQGTYIGDDVTVGHMVLLHACNLKNASFVGMGSIVLDECTIETHGMLAAGALLTAGKIVKSGELWAGRPAKLMRSLTPEEIRSFTWTVETYSERAREFDSEFRVIGKERFPKP